MSRQAHSLFAFVVVPNMCEGIVVCRISGTTGSLEIIPGSPFQIAYALVGYLARGGMGTVWLAEDTVLRRRVALKVLDLVAPADDLATRLLQEARILAGLEHPGIVPVHEAGTLADGRAFYCMKYVEGHILSQHIANKSLPNKLRLLFG
jgi:serine/threonine-protein kinase